MITSNNRTDLFYGSQRITSRYLGDRLIWGKDLDAKAISFSGIFFSYMAAAYSFYNYSVVSIQINSVGAQPLQGKNIVSVEVDGKTSDVKWTFPTSGSSLTQYYLTVESTAATFTQVQNKVKSDYGIPSYKTVQSVVVYYTD